MADSQSGNSPSVENPAISKVMNAFVVDRTDYEGRELFDCFDQFTPDEWKVEVSTLLTRISLDDLVHGAISMCTEYHEGDFEDILQITLQILDDLRRRECPGCGQQFTD